MSVERKFSVNTFLFLTILLLLFLLNSFPRERPTYSEIENRSLKGRPVFTWEHFWDGTYFIQWEEYFADTFIYRESLAKISRSIEQLSGWHGKDQVQLFVHNGENYGDPLSTSPVLQPVSEDLSDDAKNDKNEEEVEEDVQREVEEVVEEKKEEPTILEDDQETELAEHPEDDSLSEQMEFQQVVGRIMIMGNKAMNLYTFDPAAGEAYAELLNRFTEKLDDKVAHKINVYFLLAPTQIEFVAKNSKYKELSSPQNETLSFIRERLHDKIIEVDAYSVMQDHVEEYLYFRTDHHWTARGAYYAYRAFMEVAGQTPIALEEYEVEVVEDFLGTTYAATLSKRLEEHPDTIELFLPFAPHEYEVYYEGSIKMDVLDLNHLDATNKYRIFLSGDRPLGKITTESENEKKIAIIKDSYGNAFVPFLIPHYREIYIIDPRQFAKNIYDLLDENDVDDVLFLTNMGTTSHQGFTNLLKQMIEK